MDWFSQAFERGAPWSFVLLAGQVVLLSMLIERSVFLLLRVRLNLAVFLQMLRKLADAGTLDRALKLTAAVDAPVGRVCRAGLQGLGKGPFWLTEEMDRVIAGELPAIHRRLGTIPLLSLAVALLGVIGSALVGASAPEFGGGGPLPFGLAEDLLLALLGVSSGIVAGLWGLVLQARANLVVLELAQCKAFVLELDAASK